MLFENNKLVKTVRFENKRNVGNIISSSKIYNSQTADELLILNISHNDLKIADFCKVISEVSQEIFMPLTVGGGIRSLDDARILFSNGADKVVLNTGFYTDENVIKQIANEFGKQAVVIGLDVKKNDAGWSVYSSSGLKHEGSLDTIIGRINSNNSIGELFVQSIDNDGKMSGFDINLYKYIEDKTTLPIIACGGCGNYDHIYEVFRETNISAVSCGSLYNFTDSNLLRAKSYLSNKGIPVKRV